MIRLAKLTMGKLTFGRRAWTDFTLAAVVLTGILGTMVYQRVQHLRTGREIVLPIRPVDPRDLFKGDYVRLAYDISQPKPALLKSLEMRGRPLFVTLEQAAPDADWSIAAVAVDRPVGVAANQVVIAAKTSGGTWLTFGIERYYVQEGTGPKLEDQARKGKLAAIVAVDRHGKTAIKGLMLDGKKIYDEPLL